MQAAGRQGQDRGSAMIADNLSAPVARPLYAQQRFVFLALDPVHVGAGGYRLGRVDMTIAREPGTNLPKIPGTSVAGAARSYAAMRYGKPQAGGQHRNFVGERAACPIIYTFGTATDTDSGISGAGTSGRQASTQAGTVSIGDAQLLLFPVASQAGPLWVSTREILEGVWGSSCISPPRQDDKEIWPEDSGRIVTSLTWSKAALNLGWLLLNAQGGLIVDPGSQLQGMPQWQAIKGRLALVTPKLFTQIVNSNLEVRTSVSINPATGAAEDQGLFTYEALPRAAWLWCDVVEDDYRSTFPPTDKQFRHDPQDVQNKGTENAGASLGKGWRRPLDVVTAGIHLMEYLGIGGMGTRGFGRIQRVYDWEVKAQ